MARETSVPAEARIRNPSGAKRGHHRVGDRDQVRGERHDRHGHPTCGDPDPGRIARDQEELGRDVASDALELTVLQSLQGAPEHVLKGSKLLGPLLRLARRLRRVEPLRKDSFQDARVLETLFNDALLRVGNRQEMRAMTAPSELAGERVARIQVRRPVDRHQDDGRHVRATWWVAALETRAAKTELPARESGRQGWSPYFARL